LLERKGEPLTFLTKTVIQPGQWQDPFKKAEQMCNDADGQ